MASLRVKIGASADQRSFDVVFGQLEKRGVRATQVMAKQFAQLFKLVELRSDKAAAHVGKAMAGIGPRGVRGRASDYSKPMVEGAKAGNAALLREAKARLRLETAYERQAIKERYREEIRAARAAAAETRRIRRAEQSEATRSARRFAERTSHRATRFLWPNAPIASVASRALGDVARGAGVNWNLTGLMSTVTNQQRIATTLSNKAYIQGAEGPAGQRVDPRQLVGSARSLARQYGGGGTENILQGALAFVNQRGNLAGWNAISEDLVKRSVAQGANVSEVGLTAAKIDSALASQGDFAQDDDLRNRTIVKVMDNLIRQGKVGSIDFDSMAKEIPKLSGIAASITGDTATNISKLMTVAQLAERGPAKNSATASTFAQNFALDLPKRADAFRQVAGVELFSKDGKTRDLEDIIVETLAATEGTRKMTSGRKKGKTLTQMEQLQELLPNKRSFLALQEFVNVFQGAGGGKAGTDAVRAEFAKFGGSDDQLDSDLAQVLETTANKAERFNAKLEDIVDEVTAELVPALEALAPQLLDMAKTAGKVTTWLLENPKTAIALAIAAAITRAGVESVMRASIESVVLGKGGENATAFGRAMGKFTAGVHVAAAGVAAFAGTVAAIDAIVSAVKDEQAKEHADRVDTLNKGNKASALLQEAENTDDPVERMRILQKAHSEASGAVAGGKRDLATLEENQESMGRNFLDYLMPYLELPEFMGGTGIGSSEEARESRDAAEQQMIEHTKRSMESSEKLLNRILLKLEEGLTVKTADGSPLSGRAPAPVPGQSG